MMTAGRIHRFGPPVTIALEQLEVPKCAAAETKVANMQAGPDKMCRAGPMWLLEQATSRRNTNQLQKGFIEQGGAMRRLQRQRSNHANDIAVHAWGHA
jgi:hypothetical protein